VQNDFINSLFAKASASPQRIVLSEGTSSRVQKAAASATKLGLAKITLLGPKQEIRRGLSRFVPQQRGISVLDPRESRNLDQYAEEFLRVRKHKAPDQSAARTIVSGELGHAAMMVRMGDADGTIGGATNTTADTIRSFLQIIGLEPGCDLVSAFMFMLSPPESALGNVLFADCALIVDPNERQLAAIAESTAKSAQAFLGMEPRVALLSFSTAGSGTHPKADAVRTAVKMAHERLPSMIIPYEMQFDAAVDQAIQKRKLPSGQKSFGTPNVFIFPSLNAANIGYKIAERIGGMKAIGTVLQGLAKPANDLSRGCSSDDILAMIAVTCVQAQAMSAHVDSE